MAIRWDKFTVKSQEAMQAATNLALEHGNAELQPLHMLAALLEDRDGIIVPLLQKVGVPTEQLLAKTNEAVAPAAQGERRQFTAGAFKQHAEGAGSGVQRSRQFQG